MTGFCITATSDESPMLSLGKVSSQRIVLAVQISDYSANMTVQQSITQNCVVVERKSPSVKITARRESCTPDQGQGGRKVLQGHEKSAKLSMLSCRMGAI